MTKCYNIFENHQGRRPRHDHYFSIGRWHHFPPNNNNNLTRSIFNVHWIYLHLFENGWHSFRSASKRIFSFVFFFFFQFQFLLNASLEAVLLLRAHLSIYIPKVCFRVVLYFSQRIPFKFYFYNSMLHNVKKIFYFRLMSKNKNKRGFCCFCMDSMVRALSFVHFVHIFHILNYYYLLSATEKKCGEYIVYETKTKLTRAIQRVHKMYVNVKNVYDTSVLDSKSKASFLSAIPFVCTLCTVHLFKGKSFG